MTGSSFLSGQSRRPGKGRTPAERTTTGSIPRSAYHPERHPEGQGFRIMGERCRSRLKKYDVINDIVCGLVN